MNTEPDARPADVDVDAVLTAEVRDVIRRAVLAVPLAFAGGGAIDVVTASDPNDATGVHHLFGTAEANGEPSVGYDQRRGRCYELAGYAVAFGLLERAPRALLVHGSMHGLYEGNLRIGHAWVEFGDRLVWEPIRGIIRDAAEWERVARPWQERAYALTDVRRNLAASGHYGRWHESRYP